MLVEKSNLKTLSLCYFLYILRRLQQLRKFKWSFLKKSVLLFFLFGGGDEISFVVLYLQQLREWEKERSP